MILILTSLISLQKTRAVIEGKAEFVKHLRNRHAWSPEEVGLAQVMLTNPEAFLSYSIRELHSLIVATILVQDGSGNHPLKGIYGQLVANKLTSNFIVSASEAISIAEKLVPTYPQVNLHFFLCYSTSDDEFAKLCQHPAVKSNLSSLDLSLCKDIKDLSHLQQLTKLESLELHKKHYKYLQFIGSLTQLKSLCLTWCGKLKDIEPLRQLVHLKKLDLKWCDNLQSISCLANLKSLKSLNLRFCTKLDDSAFPILAELPNLQYIFTTGTRISTESLDTLRSIQLSRNITLELD